MALCIVAGLDFGYCQSGGARFPALADGSVFWQSWEMKRSGVGPHAVQIRCNANLYRQVIPLASAGEGVVIELSMMVCDMHQAVTDSRAARGADNATRAFRAWEPAGRRHADALFPTIAWCPIAWA